MNRPHFKRYPKCRRCEGTGSHFLGVCFDCRGIGFISADYRDYKQTVDGLLSELGKADLILNAMLNAMNTEQKALVAAQLEASGVSPDGMTRAHEREEILKSFDM